MIRASLVSPFCVIALFVATGCGAADSSEQPSTSDVASVQQATTMPISDPVEPGPCVNTCLRWDPDGIGLGHCCVCQDTLGTLQRSTTSPFFVVCR